MLSDVPTGLSLHAAEAGAGRPLVLVHGWSFSHAAFAPQLAALASRARVLAVDLRGHGGSPAPEAGYAVDDFAADLARFFEQRELRGAVLAGWSWGAEVALAALPRLLPRLAGLALLSATPRFTAGPGWPHGVPPANVRALSRRLARDPDGTRRLFVDGLFADGELDAPARAALAGELLAIPPALHAARETLDALAAADLRPQVALARELPVLLVHGEADTVCSPATARWLAAELPAARLLLLPGAGHAPHLTRSRAVNDALAALVEAA
jgi:pimeloyl-[acyl-carrier protein] methyl ester esterase